MSDYRIKEALDNAEKFRTRALMAEETYHDSINGRIKVGSPDEYRGQVHRYSALAAMEYARATAYASVPDRATSVLPRSDTTWEV